MLFVSGQQSRLYAVCEQSMYITLCVLISEVVLYKITGGGSWLGKQLGGRRQRDK